MKKYFYLILFFSSILNTRISVADTIPNAGFENWNFIGWGENPAWWSTSNGDLFPPTVIKDSASYTGNLAMKLIYTNIVQPVAQCGFSLMNHPINLGGFTRNEMSNNDSIKI